MSNAIPYFDVCYRCSVVCSCENLTGPIDCTQDIFIVFAGVFTIGWWYVHGLKCRSRLESCRFYRRTIADCGVRKQTNKQTIVRAVDTGDAGRHAQPSRNQPYSIIFVRLCVISVWCTCLTSTCTIRCLRLFSCPNQHVSKAYGRQNNPKLDSFNHLPYYQVSTNTLVLG